MKKRLVKLTSAILAASMAFGPAVPATTQAFAKTRVIRVETRAPKTIKVGQQKQIYKSPLNAKFYSTNRLVAAVTSDGVVIGIKPGKATIVKKTKNGTYKTKVTVKKKTTKPKTIEVITQPQQTIIVGQTKQIYKKTGKFASTNKWVAKIDSDGTVTGLAPGTATITKTTKTKKYKTKVTVKAYKNQYSSTLNLAPGNITKPDNTLANAKYSTNNSWVATVSQDGTITANGVGTARITEETETEKFVIDVTVANPTSVANVIAAGSDIYMNVGGTAKIPGISASAIYTSNNPLVATIGAGGVINGVGVGNAVITAYEGNRQTVVNVIVGSGTTNTATTLGQDLNLVVGQSQKVNGIPAGSTYQMSGTGVISIGADGTITALSPGTVVVVAKNGNTQTVMKVTVNTDVGTAVSRNPDVQLVEGGKIQVAGAVNGAAYSSSNTAVAVVASNGIVTGVSEGKATITETIGNVSILTDIHVTPYSKNGVTIARNPDINIVAGQTIMVTGAVTGADYYSSNTDVATVAANGTITAHKAGIATITERIGNTEILTDVVVRPVDVEAANYTRAQDVTIKLSNKVKLPSATDGATYTSSDEKIVTVSTDGYVTGLKSGAVIVTMKKDSKIVDTKVVVASDYSATGRALAYNAGITLNIGEKMLLPTRVGTATYTSSNTNIVGVSTDGIITAKNKGTANVTEYNGNTQVVTKVTVIDPSDYAETPVSPIDQEFTIGSMGHLNDAPGNNYGATYSVANGNILLVTSKGVVIPKIPGVTTVTITFANGQTSTKTVRVNA